MSKPASVIEIILDIDPLIKKFVYCGARLYGSCITKAVECENQGLSLDDARIVMKKHLENSDVDIHIYLPTIKKVSTKKVSAWLESVTNITNIELKDFCHYGELYADHYHIHHNNILFDISVTKKRNSLDSADSRFSMENLIVWNRKGVWSDNFDDTELYLDLLFEHKNCPTVDIAKEHIANKLLILVETKRARKYTNYPEKFIGRTLRRLPEWTISKDIITNRLLVSHATRSIDKLKEDPEFYKLYCELITQFEMYNWYTKYNLHYKQEKLLAIHDPARLNDIQNGYYVNMDKNLYKELGYNRDLYVEVDDTEEVWHFLFEKEICLGMIRNGGPIYFRADNGDPRNGTDHGLYFYRVIGNGKMEQIRIYDMHTDEIKMSITLDNE